MTVGERIRWWRRQRCITLQQVADYTNLSVGQLSKIELGQRGLLFDEAISIADALSVKLDELAYDTAAMSTAASEIVDHVMGVKR